MSQFYQLAIKILIHDCNTKGLLMPLRRCRLRAFGGSFLSPHDHWHTTFILSSEEGAQPLAKPVESFRSHGRTSNINGNTSCSAGLAVFKAPAFLAIREWYTSLQMWFFRLSRLSILLRRSDFVATALPVRSQESCHGPVVTNDRA